VPSNLLISPTTALLHLLSTSLQIRPTKTVSFDPWGHLVPEVFKHEIEDLGLDVRPSIAITKAHLKMSELDDAARKGTIEVDGSIVLRSQPLTGAQVMLNQV